MAATSTNVVRGDWGAFYISIDNVALDSSYPLGYSVPTSIGINKILAMAPIGVNTAGLPYDPIYCTQDGLIHIYESPAANLSVKITGGAATASAIPLSISTNTTAAALVSTVATGTLGTLTIAGSTFGITDVNKGFTEVASGTSLAGITVTMMTIGY